MPACSCLRALLRELHREHRALAGATGYLDRAALEFDQHARERKAEPGSFVPPRATGIDLREFLENPVEIRSVDTDAGVAYFKPEAFFLQRRGNGDRAA